MVDQTLALCYGTLNRKFQLIDLSFEMKAQAMWVENVGASGQWEQIIFGHHHLKADVAFKLQGRCFYT